MYANIHKRLLLIKYLSSLSPIFLNQIFLLNILIIIIIIISFIIITTTTPTTTTTTTTTV
jgi:t-SNARE complex subunit (syntaxin)